MENWNRLVEAGREIALTFDLLDRMDTVSGISSATIITAEGLLLAAREAVARANVLMGRPLES